MFEFIQGFGLIPQFMIVIIALWLIVKSADFFVKGASSISIKLGISAFVVGLTIVAIGTSAPEMFVNIMAALDGATGLSIGNILGSNIANILLALGIAAVFVPLTIHSRTVWKEFPYSLLAGIMVFILGGDLLINKFGEGIITRIDGLILLAFFGIFIVYTFRLNRMNDDTEKKDGVIIYSWLISIVYIIGGLIGLLLGGKLVVESATGIASLLGMSQNLIGLTIVAIGTSLPEIVTSIVAVRKGFIDMVVGGVIGSNIFNIFLILGLTAFITPLQFNQDNITDALFLIIVSLVLFIAMFVGKKHTLERWQGIIFILLYIGYIGFAVLREIL